MKLPKEIVDLTQLLQVLQKTPPEKRFAFIVDHFSLLETECLNATNNKTSLTHTLKNMDALFAVFQSPKAQIDLAVLILGKPALKDIDTSVRKNVVESLKHALQLKLKNLPEVEHKEYLAHTLQLLQPAEQSVLNAWVPAMLKDAKPLKPNFFDQHIVAPNGDNKSTVNVQPALVNPKLKH